MRRTTREERLQQGRELLLDFAKPSQSSHDGLDGPTSFAHIYSAVFPARRVLFTWPTHATNDDQFRRGYAIEFEHGVVERTHRACAATFRNLLVI